MAMKIAINNKTNRQIDLNLIKQVVAEFARVHKIRHQEISIAFVGDAEIKKINQAYRKTSEPTDILTFAGEDDFLGELVHGLLHLLGYNDENEEARLEMIKLGEKFMKTFKF